MVMWQIKLKGMSNRHGRIESYFYPRNILLTLEWGQRVKYHMISLRAWGFAMARHRMCSSFLLKSVSYSVGNPLLRLCDGFNNVWSLDDMFLCTKQ